MSQNTNSSAGLASAIVGAFDAVNGQPDNVKNTWAFEYNKTQNTINFLVQIGIPPMLIDNSNQSLQTTISTDDIDELINWFSIVKMNSNSSNSNSKK